MGEIPMPELLHPGVYVFEISSGVRPIEGVSTSTAAFIGVADKGPIPGTTLPNGKMAAPVMITSFTDYVRQFGGYRTDSFLTYAVKAFFDNGGRRLYIVRVATIKNADNTKNALASTNTATALKLSALTEGPWGDKITVEIADSASGTAGDAAQNFKLTVKYDNAVVETYDPVTRQGSPTLQDSSTTPAEYVRTAVNSRSEFIAITADIGARPANTAVNAPLKFTGGKDGDPLNDLGFTGQPAPDNTVTGTGLNALDKITDVNIIAIPGRGNKAVVDAGTAYCKVTRPLQDCFFIGDVGLLDPTNARSDSATPDLNLISDAVTFATTTVNTSTGDYGAIYFPWIWSVDPIGTGRNPKILLPPSGFMAGIYARTDNSRGVFKAPAGTEAGVIGSLAVAATVSDTEQDLLNPVKVNAIRTVPGSGIVVWGTRTFGSDAEWRYIPVRRIAIFLRVSIYYGIQWAVFEPNDEPLWASLRLNIRSFMMTQFRAGAFQGSKPDDAFFVKCDSDTTTQIDIDNGVVNILVGFAPLKPAEFVVLRLQQKVNQQVA
jgi:phage tail sheath protein FI